LPGTPATLPSVATSMARSTERPRHQQSSVAILHQGAPGHLTWLELEDPPPRLISTLREAEILYPVLIKLGIVD